MISVCLLVVAVLYCRYFERCLCVCIFFFKQKTAYEMRISDWSSDVCSSDLQDLAAAVELAERYPGDLLMETLIEGDELTVAILGREVLPSIHIVARQSVV